MLLRKLLPGLLVLLAMLLVYTLFADGAETACQYDYQGDGDIDGQHDGTDGDPPDGERITRWTDKSGKGHHAIPETGDASPAEGLPRTGPAPRFCDQPGCFWHELAEAAEGQVGPDHRDDGHAGTCLPLVFSGP